MLQKGPISHVDWTLCLDLGTPKHTFSVGLEDFGFLFKCFKYFTKNSSSLPKIPLIGTEQGVSVVLLSGETGAPYKKLLSNLVTTCTYHQMCWYQGSNTKQVTVVRSQNIYHWAIQTAEVFRFVSWKKTAFFADIFVDCTKIKVLQESKVCVQSGVFKYHGELLFCMFIM